MSRSVEIRRATEADAPALAGHRVAMFRDMGSADPSIHDALRAAAAPVIRDWIVAGDYVAWVAHVAGSPHEIVGGAGVQLRPLLPRPHPNGRELLAGREGNVVNVYVERSHRRQGIARRLMEAIVAWAPTGGVARIVLHASDEGRPLYDSMGFVPTNEMRYTGEL